VLISIIIPVGLLNVPIRYSDHCFPCHQNKLYNKVSSKTQSCPVELQDKTEWGWTSSAFMVKPYVCVCVCDLLLMCELVDWLPVSLWGTKADMTFHTLQSRIIWILKSHNIINWLNCEKLHGQFFSCRCKRWCRTRGHRRRCTNTKRERVRQRGLEKHKHDKH